MKFNYTSSLVLEQRDLAIRKLLYSWYSPVNIPHRSAPFAGSSRMIYTAYADSGTCLSLTTSCDTLYAPFTSSFLSLLPWVLSTFPC